MTNAKISALFSATTPLAGTETLPVVQGGATTKVTVANLTAGRAVSAASLALTTSPLPATSGGTGSASAFAANAIAYASSTTALATSANWTYDGTNAVLLNGGIGIGTASLGGTSGLLHISSAATGGTTVRLAVLDSQVQSDVTVSTSYSFTAANTATASFTTTEINHYDASQGTFGSGSVVSNQYGFRVRPTLIGATNNYAFRGQIPNGTSRYNLYMDGTATNYLAGGLNLGATTDPGAGNLSLTGNVIQGTAAKGFNFTANTATAGMTSQLLNWYEEGTWTPADASGAGLTFTAVTARFVRVGSQINVTATLTYPTTVNASQAKISGLPYAPSVCGQLLLASPGNSSNAPGQGLIAAASTTILFVSQNNLVKTNSLLSTLVVYFSGSYIV